MLAAACQAGTSDSNGGRATGGSVGQNASGGAGGAAGSAASPGAGGAAGAAASAGSGGAAPSPETQADAGSSPEPDPSVDAGGDVMEPEAGDAGTAADAGPAAARGRGAVCTGGPYEAPRGEGARSICNGFRFKHGWNEGPTWVASQQAFFFSNFVVGAAGPGDMIKYDPATDRCEVFIEGNGCNGLAVAPDGSLIAACHTPRAVLRYDLTTKKSTTLVEMVDGRRLDTPNDVVVHDNGTIYFTNPPYELAGRPAGAGMSVWRIDPAGATHLISRARVNPLGLSPDQKRLYVAGGYWELDAEGVPLRRAGNFNLGGDGIAVDCAGNVYTQNGAIVGPNNQNVGRFPGGTNMAFGGPDGKTLLMVRGRTAQTMKMNVPGLPD